MNSINEDCLSDLSTLKTDSKALAEFTTIVQGVHHAKNDGKLVDVLVNFIEHVEWGSLPFRVFALPGGFLVATHHALRHFVHVEVAIDLVGGLGEWAAVVLKVIEATEEDTGLEAGHQVA